MAGSVVKRMPCEVCGSKNNLVLHDNGGTYCYTPGCDYNLQNKHMNNTDIQASFENIEDRKIKKEICEAFDYSVGTYKEVPAHIANYRHSSGVAQKIRFLDPKDFTWEGYKNDVQLFGQHLWLPNKEQDLIITEGEIDALSIAQVTDLKQPVVSVPSGSDSALKAIQNQLEFVNGFRSIVLAMDNDLAGQKGLQKIKENFPNDQIKVLKFPLKDANEMLMADRADEMLELISSVDFERPSGIVFGDELKIDTLLEPEPVGYDIPFPITNDFLRGIKRGRLYIIGAGTGVGKSSFSKELVYSWFINYPNAKIANIFLEESQKNTLQSYVALHENIPQYKLSEHPEHYNTEKLTNTFNTILKRKNLAFLDHFGSLESKRLLSMLDYLAVSKKFEIIILDHISIAISGTQSSREGERKDIDILMTKLRELIEKTGVTIIAISHLSRPMGDKGFEEGKVVNLNSFRGSGSIAQVADVVIGLERDQMSDSEKDKTTIRILKNRITGQLGVTDRLYYINDTGRLKTSAQLFTQRGINHD